MEQRCGAINCIAARNLSGGADQAAGLLRATSRLKPAPLMEPNPDGQLNVLLSRQRGRKLERLALAAKGIEDDGSRSHVAERADLGPVGIELVGIDDPRQLDGYVAQASGEHY